MEKHFFILDLTDSMSKAEGVQKIQRFIGSCNFYRRHLRNFTEASAPLTDLIKKETPWRWGPIEKQAIEDVKKKIRECLVLGVKRYPEPHGQVTAYNRSPVH